MFACRAICAFLLAVSGAASLCAQTGFALKNGDRVVFYGDSITDQRLYTTFAESYVLTRFPSLNVTFVHSGWSGDTVRGGGGGPIELRLDRDVFAYQPTVMTIMLGMNDGEYRAFDPKVFEAYSIGYEKIVKTVKSRLPGIRITAIQPSPFDDVTRPPDFEGGYNAVLVRYGQYVKELAARENLTAADLNSAVVAALQKANAADPKLAKDFIPDRVHPEAAGHLLMAEQLLKSWNAPSLVSSVEIDAVAHSVVAARNAAVQDLAAFGNGLAWTQKDEALPFPLSQWDPALKLAVKSSDFLEAMDQQMLRIDGLATGQWRLSIDGKEIARHTAGEWAAGVNLADLPTPMQQQASRVHDLTVRHNNLHYTRWRDLQVPLGKEDLPRLAATMKALDDMEADLIQLQRAAAQPKPHRYELAPE